MVAIYTCGRCDAPVHKDTTRCPRCSVLLSGIQCKGCGFVGARTEFADDHCPRCGIRVQVPPFTSPSSGGGREQSAAPAPIQLPTLVIALVVWCALAIAMALLPWSLPAPRATTRGGLPLAYLGPHLFASCALFCCALVLGRRALGLAVGMMAFAIASLAELVLALLMTYHLVPYSEAIPIAVRAAGTVALMLGIWSLREASDRWQRWRRLLLPLAVCLAMATLSGAFLDWGGVWFATPLIWFTFLRAMKYPPLQHPGSFLAASLMVLFVVAHAGSFLLVQFLGGMPLQIHSLLLRLPLGWLAAIALAWRGGRERAPS